MVTGEKRMRLFVSCSKLGGSLSNIHMGHMHTNLNRPNQSLSVMQKRKEKKKKEDNVWWIIALSLCSYWKLFEQSYTFTFASIQLGVLYIGGKLAGISRLRWSISTIPHYFSDRPVLVRAIQTIEFVRAMGCRNSMPWNLPFERSGS